MFSCAWGLYTFWVSTAVMSKSTLEARKLEPIGPVLFLSIYIYLYITKPRGQEKINPLAILFGMRAVFSLGPCTGLKLQCFLIVLMSFYTVFSQLGKFPVPGCCACTQNEFQATFGN